MIVCPTCNTPASDGEKCQNCGTLFVDDHDPLLGEVINDKFRVVHAIGVGASGKVYRAEHMALGVDVALKVLHSHRQTDPRLVKQFEREARANSTLPHPNSVQVLDYGTDGQGRMFIAMELLGGQTLAQVLTQRGPMDLQRTVRIASQVLGALDEAHYCNIVHRDLKPDNIIVEDRPGEPDFVTVLDFGTVDEGDLPLRGGIIGTPEYMSPEQARGEVRLDGRSDLYAVGVILYEMVTGCVPFSGETPLAIASRHIKEPVQPPSQRRPDLTIPAELEAIILRCLDKERDNRPAHAADLARELAATLPEGALDITGRVVIPRDLFGPRGQAAAAARSTAAPAGSAKRRTLALIAAFLIAGAGVAVWVLTLSGVDDTSAPAARGADDAPAAAPDVTSDLDAIAPEVLAEAAPTPASDVVEASDTTGPDAGEEWSLEMEPQPAAAADDNAQVKEEGAEDTDGKRSRRSRSSRGSDSVTKEMLKRAKKHLAEGNTKTAKRLVEQVLKRDPSNTKAKRLAAELGM